MLAAAGRPAVVPVGADDRRHRRHDDHGEVKYDGGGICTSDYGGHAYDYDGGHIGDDHHSGHHNCHVTCMMMMVASTRRARLFELANCLGPA
jgi:hypothetical protein